MRKMRAMVSLVALALLAVPAFADDRAVITAHMQEMADALVPGDVAVWDKYLDAAVIYAEEDDSYKGKAETLKELQPLPKGLGGTIKIELLSYHEEGDVAVGLFRQIETEHYFAQTIFAKYLTNTTWRKRADGWKMVAGQVLAERTDPPGIKLPASQLAQYVGTYRLKDSEPSFTLDLANGQLMGTRSGHKPAPWNAEASDVFFIAGDPRIRKIFQRDASGRVTGFVERRESWDIEWVKVGPPAAGH
jgi:ketosteroid isomerase-like protein